MRICSGSTVVIVLAGLLGCATDSPTAPPPVEKIVLKPMSPLVSSGKAGDVVDPAPLVRAENAAGLPVARVRVDFWAGNGGSIAVTETFTDQHGLASPGEWRLSERAGANVLLASLRGEPPLEFVVTGMPGPAVKLTKVSGDSQAGFPGDLISPPAVRVSDRFGNPIKDVAVSFETTGGDSHVHGEAVTDEMGMARPQWLLGTTLGVNHVTASISGGASVVFVARTLDPSAATWFKVDSIGGYAPHNMFVAEALIALSDGYFVERQLWLWEWSGSYAHRYSGTYAQSGSVITMTTAGGTTSPWARVRVESAVRSGDWLVIVRADADFLFPISWKYKKVE